MNEITRHIEYLLRSHECVVVPGFGAFIAQHRPAHYDAENHLFYPPSTTVIFNPSLTHNDGLLASSVARRDGISFERAARLVNDETAAMRSQLQNDGELRAGHLGRFTFEEGKTIFYPTDTYSVAPANFRLKPVSVARICDRIGQPQKTIEHSRPTIIGMHRYLKVAASIVVILMMGILFSTPVSIDRSRVNYAAISLPEVKVTQPSVVTEMIELNILVPAVADGYAVADTTFSSLTVRTRFNDNDPYYLVVASLANRTQAETFVKQHSGCCRLEIIERTGKTRVIAATGTSAHEAMEPASLPEFTKQFPDAWPCHR